MASPIDKIFQDIFGYIPSKKGTAYEQLAAIASYIIGGGEVKHDDKLRGAFSKSLYQIDIHQKTDNEASMGEAKDYTDRNGKVGRGDLQKLGGALPDLTNIQSGTFFSATNYTKPAKQYAEAAEQITGKPITLYGLRPSTELDEKGFIKTIIITIYIAMPQIEQAKWLPHLTESGQEALKGLLKEGEERIEYRVYTHCYYDKDGNEILSIKELTSHGYGNINSDTNKSHACFLLKNHHVEISGVLAEINGLEYEMPYSFHTEVMKITDDSKNRFVLLDSDGKPLKIITDKKLREFEFDEDGNLKKR